MEFFTSTAAMVIIITAGVLGIFFRLAPVIWWRSSQAASDTFWYLSRFFVCVVGLFCMGRYFAITGVDSAAVSFFAYIAMGFCLLLACVYLGAFVYNTLGNCD